MPSLRVMSEKSETVWNRRPGLVGLRLRSAISPCSVLEEVDRVALDEVQHAFEPRAAMQRDASIARRPPLDVADHFRERTSLRIRTDGDDALTPDPSSICGTPLASTSGAWTGRLVSPTCS